MTNDTVLPEGGPASRPEAREDTEAILSYYHSDLAGEPYMTMTDQESGRRHHSTTGPEPSTRQANSPNDPSPSSPFLSGNKMRNDSFGTTAVHRRKNSNNVDSAADNRRFAIVPPKVDTPCPVPEKGDETGHVLCASEVSSPLPSPSAGRGGQLINAQLAASAPALVAPRDTHSFTLHDISTPLIPTSPSPTSSSSHSPTTPKRPHSHSSTKHEKSRIARSAAAHSRSSSRDVGIVGTVTRLELELPRDLPSPQDTPSDYQPPIFQTPSLRSSSPDISSPVDTNPFESGSSTQTSSSGAVHVRSVTTSTSIEPIHSVSSGMNGHGVLVQPQSAPSLTAASPRHQLVSTPDHGQVPPLAATPISMAPSAYLHYQPGVHSKAGPLPPPPRAMFDIDFTAPPPPRPPRLRSPSPLTSQKGPRSATPTSVTLTLASKASAASIHQIQFSATPLSRSESSSDDSEYTPESETEPSSPDHTVKHTREGAFPPSTILVTPAERNHSLPEKAIELVPEPPSKDQLPSLPTDILDSASAISAEPLKDELSPNTAHCPELRRESSWVSNSNESGHASSESGRRAFEDVRSGTPQERNGPYPRKKESGLEDNSSETKRKGGLLTNLKRYSSLPRPPSRSPRLSIFTRSSSPKSPPRIRAKSPDAMRFREILSKRTGVERAIGYAHKINELAMYDCGLGDWVASMKERGSSKTRLVPASPQDSDTSLPTRPRHASRSSISSEMTFPLRSDAWIATDLSQRDIDTVPSPNVPPPALPYPALAGVPPSTNVMGSQTSHASPLLTGSKVTGGFFSALGRNSSTRKDSIISRTAQPPAARLSKPLPSASPSAANPRPVQITSAPSVPGGPRAFPSRVQRSRTLMLGPSPAASETVSPSPLMRRRSNTLKRPSFFGRSAPGPAPGPGAPPSAEFQRQVERLAELLPHADKDVLAGYLRRAGQDILAIGQYLEDEKNGSVRRD